MSPSDKIAQLEARLRKAKVDKAKQEAEVKVEVECKAAEEQQIAKKKGSCGGEEDC